VIAAIYRIFGFDFQIIAKTASEHLDDRAILISTKLCKHQIRKASGASLFSIWHHLAT